MDYQFFGKLINMRILLILILSICFACNSTIKSNKICSIYQENNLVERRHIDANNKTTSIITFDSESRTPIDSIKLSYNELEIDKIKAFIFSNNHYELNPLKYANDYYFKVYIDTTCNLGKLSLNKFLMEDVISNICYIQNSILPNGDEVSFLAKTTKNKDTIDINYSPIGSRFNDLPEVFQSFFYNQPLDSLRLKVRDKNLQKEQYFFKTGTLTREFYYKNDILKKANLRVKYYGEKKLIADLVRIYEIKDDSDSNSSN